MKTKSNLTACLLLGLACGFSVNAQKAITKKNLPVTAQTFLKTHFSGLKPVSIIEDDDDYKVRFANAIEVEFDEKGNWEEVDGNDNPIPTSMIPKKILSYIKTNYPNVSITKINKEERDYEVDLSNGTELEFNSKGNILEIDN